MATRTPLQPQGTVRAPPSACPPLHPQGTVSLQLPAVCSPSQEHPLHVTTASDAGVPCQPGLLVPMAAVLKSTHLQLVLWALLRVGEARSLGSSSYSRAGE